ncbi:MAG: hypothetical protein AMXMBFR82_38530 [Candidatus Hydrogenedentota bacterium]
MKHLKLKTKKLPIRADGTGPKIPDPCEGLSGKALKKCRKENPDL